MTLIKLWAVKHSLDLWFTFGFALIMTVAMLMSVAEKESSAGFDKIIHLISFMVLVMPVSFCRPRSWIWLAPAAIFFGLVIEIIQPSFGRGREWLDFVADLVGVGIGVVLAGYLSRRWQL